MSRAADLTTRRSFATSWVAVGTLALCVASEYKFRTRAVDQTVNGKIDPFIVLELGVYGVVALLLFWSMGSPPRFRSAPFVQVSRWIYTGVLAASAVYAVYPALAVARAGELLVSAAFAQAVQRHASSRQLRLMANAFVGLVAVSVLGGLVHRFPQPREQQHRFTWLYVHPIIAANYCGLAVIFCAALWLRNRRLNRVRRAGHPGLSGAGYVALFVLVLAALVATHTRMALAATGVALVVYALLMTRVSRKRIDLLVVLMLTGLVALVVIGPQLYGYLSRGESGSQLATLNNRTQLWSQAFGEIAKRPLLGHGIGSTHGLFLGTAGLGGAHDAAINVLTDAGVIGCLVWIVFLGAVLYAEVRLLRVARGPMEAPLLLALFAFLLTNSITTEGLGAAANVQQLMLFLSSAWVVCLAREKARLAAAAPERPTRVLALHPVADRYGSDKVFVQEVLTMQRGGLDVQVMIAEAGPLEDEFAAHGFSSTRLRAPVLRKRLLRPLALVRLAVITPFALLSLVRTFRRAQADLICVNTATLPHCLVAARLAGIPVVCHVRELESTIPRLLSRLVTAPLLLATGLIANSRATAAHLRRDWPPLAGRTVVAYNGAEAPAGARVAAHAIRRIGVVGRLSPRKGQDLAVEAVSALLERGRDVELVLFGDCFPGYEWYESQLRAAASEHAARIQLAGYRSDVWQAYRELDLVLVPSRLEPFGMVALEAALSRRPVIAARVGGLPEIIRDGLTGMLVEPDDAAALAEAIDSLLADPARAESFARAAAEDASFRFAPRQTEERVLGVLRRCSAGS